MSSLHRTALDESWPERHRRTLAAWIASKDSQWTEKQRSALDRGMASLQSADGGIVALLGPRGAGKTLLASALAHNALAHRSQHREQFQRRTAAEGAWTGVGTARYWVLADLFAGERASWQKERTGWERVSSTLSAFVGRGPLDDAHAVDLLVLDEIQERAESDWEDRELTRLIDARYRACRSTVLVGNLKPEELGSRLGPSIVSRISEGGEVIACAWDSFRGPKRPVTTGGTP